MYVSVSKEFKWQSQVTTSRARYKSLESVAKEMLCLGIKLLQPDVNLHVVYLT